MSGPGRYWAVVPAAGSGSRMDVDTPKQYLLLRGKTVLSHTLQGLLTCDKIIAVVVALASDDTHWTSLEESHDPRVHKVMGGATRADSVLNALHFLETMAAPDDRVLVHDAARPCLRAVDLHKLIQTLEDSAAVGALLAVPVHDTMKRGNSACEVLQTVSRENLWHALTPQCFELGKLRAAIEAGLRDGLAMTDEAFAMEVAGYRPLLVEGSSDNIKITRQADLQLAELYLSLAAQEANHD